MEKPNFFNKAKEVAKKGVFVGALVGGLISGEKTVAQTVGNDFSKKGSIKIKAEISPEQKKEKEILNLIYKLEKSIKKKSGSIMRHPERKVFAIVSEEDLRGIVKMDNYFLPEETIADQISVNFINGKNNEDKILLGRSSSDLGAMDEGSKLADEGYIDIGENNKMEYLRPDYYVVISNENEKETGKLRAKIFSLSEKKLIEEVSFDYKIQEVKSGDDDVKLEILMNFDKLVQERISQLEQSTK